jgi:nitroreductase
MTNLMIAATALGLGTRWFGNPLLDPGSLRELLSIPESVEIIAATPVGYHSEPNKERPQQSLDAHSSFVRGDKYRLADLLDGRLALEDVLHYNEYGCRRSEAQHG